MDIYPINLRAKHRKNLEKLASYLETLPKNYKHFEMADFIEDEQAARKYAATRAVGNELIIQCGTVACAAGHGPAAGIRLDRKYVERGDWGIDWSSYVDDKFLNRNPTAFEWCFGGGWSMSDNHHWGAAARIRFLLDNKGVPEEFEVDEDPSRYYQKFYKKYRIDERVQATIDEIKNIKIPEPVTSENAQGAAPCKEKQLLKN